MPWSRGNNNDEELFVPQNRDLTYAEYLARVFTPDSDYGYGPVEEQPEQRRANNTFTINFGITESLRDVERSLERELERAGREARNNSFTVSRTSGTISIPDNYRVEWVPAVERRDAFGNTLGFYGNTPNTITEDNFHQYGWYGADPNADNRTVRGLGNSWAGYFENGTECESLSSDRQQPLPNQKGFENWAARRGLA